MVMIQHKFFWLMMVVFLATRIPLILAVDIAPWSDAEWYFYRAISIADGRGYYEGDLPTAYWPVGWPGFLSIWFAIFSPSTTVVEWINVVCSLLIVIMLYKIAERTFDDQLVSNLTLFFSVIYLNHIGYVPLALSELFYTALIFVLIWLLFGRYSIGVAAIAGLIAGMAILTKPQVVLYVAFLIVLKALEFYQDRDRNLREAARFLAVFVIASAIMIVPWSARNKAVLGEWVFVSTNGGVALLTGNNPAATGGYMSGDDMRPGGLIDVPIERTVANQIEFDAVARETAVRWILDNPGQFLALMPRKIIALWRSDGEAVWSYEMEWSDYPQYETLLFALRIINHLFYFSILVLSALAIFLLVRQWHQQNWRLWPVNVMLLAVLGYILFTNAVSAVFNGQMRYHFTAMHLLLVLASWVVMKSAARYFRNNATNNEPNQ